MANSYFSKNKVIDLKKYRELNRTLDNILLDKKSAFITYSISWLHLIKDHPIFLKRYEYTIVQSGILAFMGIRENNDLDIVISSRLKKRFNRIPFGIHNDIMIDDPKFRVFGCKNDDDLVYNYSQFINGYNFAEPKFYFSRMKRKTERDLKDWAGIEKFKAMKSYEGYPFCNFTKKQWDFD